MPIFNKRISFFLSKFKTKSNFYYSSIFYFYFKVNIGDFIKILITLFKKLNNSLENFIKILFFFIFIY